MMKLKAKEAPPPYVPDGTVKCTLDEIKNGWNDASLTAFLRNSTANEYAFCLERLVRCRHRRELCVSALQEFKACAYPRDEKFKTTMARLEKAAAEADADCQFAQGQLDVASEAA